MQNWYIGVPVQAGGLNQLGDTGFPHKLSMHCWSVDMTFNILFIVNTKLIYKSECLFWRKSVKCLHPPLSLWLLVSSFYPPSGLLAPSFGKYHLMYPLHCHPPQTKDCNKEEGVISKQFTSISFMFLQHQFYKILLLIW